MKLWNYIKKLYIVAFAALDIIEAYGIKLVEKTE